MAPLPSKHDGAFPLKATLPQTAPVTIEDQMFIYEMQIWTWKGATSKPSRERSPDLGPMDETLDDFEAPPTGYQGLPSELAQQIRSAQEQFPDWTRGNAQYFERIYRDEMEMFLAGAGGEKTAEVLFYTTLNEFTSREEKRQHFAVRRGSSDSSCSDDDDVPPKGVFDDECWTQDEKEWRETCEGVTKTETSAWPKWAEHDMENTPTQIIKKFDSFDLTCLSLE